MGLAFSTKAAVDDATGAGLKGVGFDGRSEWDVGGPEVVVDRGSKVRLGIVEGDGC